MNEVPLDQIPPAQLPLVLFAIGAAGLLYCFAGYRLFRCVLGLTGFVLGGGAAASLGGFLTQQHMLTMLLCCLIGGVAGALLLFFLFRAGVFVIGALGGGLLAWQLLYARPEAWAPWAIAGAVLAGGLLAAYLQRPVITLATAMIGAWLLAALATAFVLAGLAETGFDLALAAKHLSNLASLHKQPGATWMLLVSWILLTVLGARFQFGGRSPAKE